MDDFGKLWDLLHDFEKYWTEEQEKRPFRLNLLDYCKTYENAHTQILLEILRYKDNAEYPLIESFFHKIGIDVQWNHVKSCVEFNKAVVGGFIDGFLSDGTNAVIIENKINGATDQNEQIKKYVDDVEQRGGIAIEHIYVIYLTKDGSKIVQEKSCPKDYKDKLKNHFIECNYCGHILPWLKEDVVPQCRVKDDTFVSALKQYIDFLEDMFKKRVGDDEMDEKIKEFLKEKMSLNGSGDSYDLMTKKIKALDELKNYLVSIQRSVRESVVSITNEYWKNKYADGFVQDGLYTYLLYGRSKWNKSNLMIHLEWVDMNSDEVFYKKTSFTMHLHFEGNDVSDYVKFLEKNKEQYLTEMKKVGMTLVDDKNNELNKRLNCYKIFDFSKPFAAMTDAERKNALFKAYDEAKPLLDYVYRKCEECDSNN